MPIVAPATASSPLALRRNSLVDSYSVTMLAPAALA